MQWAKNRQICKRGTQLEESYHQIPKLIIKQHQLRPCGVDAEQTNKSNE